MMDLTEKPQGSGSGSQEAKKSCVDCKTTKTPLWRGGPAGPKSLCNACGIKYRKRRRALAAMNKSGSQQSQSQSQSEEDVKISSSKSHRSYIKDNKENSKMDVSLKLRLLTLGRQVLLRRSSLEKQRKLGEEEQAAVLLMALSCGSVYS